MKKIELRVIGLSYSQSQVGSYVIVLSDNDDFKRLPIIIKPSEAQVIALGLEDVKSPRPLTHDLFKSMTDTFGLDIQEVYIYSLSEGIFHTCLLSTNGVDEVELECSVGDAIALSVLYKCPIYTTSEIIDIAGVSSSSIEESDYDDGDDDYGDDYEFLNNIKDPVDDNIDKVASIDDLKKLMDAALENEEYEIAAELRDRIKKLENSK